jgi:hypothetical protein
MELTLQNLKQLIKEAVDDREKEYSITFIGGKTEAGDVKVARGRSDMAMGGHNIEYILSIWREKMAAAMERGELHMTDSRIGVEDILEWYRNAENGIKDLNIARNIWYDIKYTPSTGKVTAASRGLPHLEENIIKK